MPSTHLLIWADIPPEHEAGFNEWYNREHAPDRVLGIPGFIQARRFVAVEGGPKYAALYEVTGPEVFQNDAYMAMRRSPDANSRKFIPQFRNVIRFMGTPIADASAVEGVIEGAWTRTVALKSGLPASADPQAWLSLTEAVVSRPGVMRARVFQALADALADSVRNMQGHDRARMRAPDRLADVLVMIEAVTREQAMDVDAALTDAIAALPGLTVLDSACMQQLMRVARGPETSDERPAT